MVASLGEVRRRLGGPGASERAAAAILEVVALSDGSRSSNSSKGSKG